MHALGPGASPHPDHSNASHSLLLPGSSPWLHVHVQRHAEVLNALADVVFVLALKDTNAVRRSHRAAHLQTFCSKTLTSHVFNQFSPHQQGGPNSYMYVCDMGSRKFCLSPMRWKRNFSTSRWEFALQSGDETCVTPSPCLQDELTGTCIFDIMPQLSATALRQAMEAAAQEYLSKREGSEDAEPVQIERIALSLLSKDGVTVSCELSGTVSEGVEDMDTATSESAAQSFSAAADEAVSQSFSVEGSTDRMDTEGVTRENLHFICSVRVRASEGMYPGLSVHPASVSSSASASGDDTPKNGSGGDASSSGEASQSAGVEEAGPPLESTDPS